MSNDEPVKLSPELRLHLELTKLSHAIKYALSLLENEIKQPSPEQIDIAVNILRAAAKSWDEFDVEKNPS